MNGNEQHVSKLQKEVNYHNFKKRQLTQLVTILPTPPTPQKKTLNKQTNKKKTRKKLQTKQNQKNNNQNQASKQTKAPKQKNKPKCLN